MAAVVMHLLNDGSGRVCIHWVYADPEGPLQSADNVIYTAAGPRILAQGRRWRCACDPERKVFGTTDAQGRLKPFPHTDSPLAATCPKCLATDKYQAEIKRLESVLATKGV